LSLIRAALLVMQPAKLLENLGVVRRVLQDSLVSRFGAVKLLCCQSTRSNTIGRMY
jgi:hypothetical protein